MRLVPCEARLLSCAGLSVCSIMSARQETECKRCVETGCFPTTINTSSAAASPGVEVLHLCINWHGTMFDHDSGQVFREWTVPHRPTSVGELDWSRKRPYPYFRPRGSRGPRSLTDMTTNIIANNIGLLSVEHIEPIPVRLVWRIWRFLEARYLCRWLSRSLPTATN